MNNDIFKTLKDYVGGYMSRQNNETNKRRLQETIDEVTAEIRKDVERAPEIIHERRKRAEINALRLSFTHGEKANYHEVEQHALNLIVMALQDSHPLGEQCDHDFEDLGAEARCKKCGHVEDDDED